MDTPILASPTADLNPMALPPASTPFVPATSHTGTAPATHEFQDGTLQLGKQELPANVVHQLNQLGYSINAYTPGQLEEAITACKIDSKLIDDPHGVNFSDTLSKDTAEIHADQYDNDLNTLSYRLCAGQTRPSSPAPEKQSWVQRVSTSAQSPTGVTGDTFVARLEEERSTTLSNELTT